MLHLENVSKTYTLSTGYVISAVEDITLDVNQGELLVLLGPSGSGKTTLLRMIAGLENPSTGAIYLDGTKVDSSGPVPGFGMIFQAYTAFPWLTVKENIAFALKYKQGVSRTHRQDIVQHLLNLVGLSNFADAFPKELSGGMKQRVALARALAAHPKVLLMDEPFNALDALTRAQLQSEFVKLSNQDHFTTLFVTHDLDEALLIADRIILLTPRPGRILAEYNLRSCLRNRDRHDSRFLELRQEIYSAMSDSVEIAVSGEAR